MRLSAGPRCPTTHGSGQSHRCARGHAFGLQADIGSGRISLPPQGQPEGRRSDFGPKRAGAHLSVIAAGFSEDFPQNMTVPVERLGFRRE